MAKILSLFDGMACGHIAFSELDIPIEEYSAYEIDKYAIQTAIHNFPDIQQLGDVFQADFTKHQGVDWLIGGSPCFTAGHQVFTDKGYKNIEDIHMGDMVLTHKNRFKPVVRLYTRKTNTVYIKIAGYKTIVTTPNHPFYTIRNLFWNPENQPEWVRVEDMTTLDYCGRHADRCTDEWMEGAAIDIVPDGDIETIIEKDGIVWTRVQNIWPTHSKQIVYNIEVEEDNSYTVNDIIVHNCTYWSIAQSKNRETVASGMGWDLFCQYVRALKEARPKYFLYENNKSMSQAIRDSITSAFGFEPVCINSALVSAQNRQRLYWVGKLNDEGVYERVNVEQPEDRGILLKDILEGANGGMDKSYAITTRQSGAMLHDTLKRHRHTMCAEPLCVASRGRYLPEGGTAQHLEVRGEKTNAITTVTKDNYIGEPIACRQVGRRLSETGHRCDYNYDIPCIQRYEANENPAKLNTLSTVTKDNLVIEPVHTTVDGKIRCIRATCYKDGQRNLLSERDPRTGIAEPVCVSRPHGWFPGRVGKTLPCLTSTGSYQWNHMIYEPVGTSENDVCYDCILQNIHSYTHQSIVDYLRSVFAVVPSDNVPDTIYEKPFRVGQFDKGGQGNRIYSMNGKAVSQMANGGGRGAKTGLYAVPLCRYAEIVEEDKAGNPIKAKSLADGKVYPVYKVENGIIVVNGREQTIKLMDGYWLIRKLTVRECARAQTVPDWYEFPCSDAQSYKMVGNGWTCEVIKHLIQSAYKS